MHKEAEEELRVRLKLVVLELAEQLGVTKACREFDVLVQAFTGGSRNTRKRDELDCIEKDRSPINIPTEHLLKWWRRSWCSARSIRWEPYELGIIWIVIMGSRFPNPR